MNIWCLIIRLFEIVSNTSYRCYLFEANLERRQSLDKFSIVYSNIAEGLNNLAKAYNSEGKFVIKKKFRRRKERRT